MFKAAEEMLLQSISLTRLMQSVQKGSIQTLVEKEIQRTMLELLNQLDGLMVMQM